jgi:hypothetical protein
VSIENTQDPSSVELTSMLLVATGDTDAVIGAQERAGQKQLVHSDRLPTELHSPREEFEAVGFVLGEPDPRDPMFAPATLPNGWKREGSDHAMWSYIVDELGRRRVSIFYKAAFYDRSAHMGLVTVYGYIGECAYANKPIVTDDKWATREAVHDACLARAKYAEEHIEQWQGIAERRRADEMSRKYIDRYTAERDKYEALAKQCAAE